MADDRQVNEVVINGETILTTRGDTVATDNLAESETATDRAGVKIVGEMIGAGTSAGDSDYEGRTGTLADAYMVTDPPDTIEEEDYIPFNDVSDSDRPKKKTLFFDLIEKLRNYFVSSKGTSGNYTLYNDAQTMSLKHEKIDASYVNNNVSSITYPSTSNILDRQGRIIMRTEAVVRPEGQIGWKAYVCNYNTEGSKINQQGIQFHMNKSGILYYVIDNPRAFREAIGTVDQLGTSLPTGTVIDNYHEGVYCGTYYFDSDTVASGITTLPEAISGKLIVANNGNGGYSQYYLPNQSVKFWMRVWWNNAWSAWQDLASGSKPHTYDTGTRILSGADLNTYITAGVYYISADGDASNIAHTPIDASGKLLVLAETGGQIRVKQIYITNSSVNKTYIRQMSNNSEWYSWQRFSFVEDVYSLTSAVYNSQISANDDLNDYTTAGTYDCLNYATASTLSNCPTTQAFKLMVDAEHNSNIVAQVITLENAKSAMPWRRSKNASGQWGDWKQFASTIQLVTNIGIDIPANSDLNNYKTSGVYKIAPDSTAATISNIPIKKAGKLIVYEGISVQNTYFKQVYMDASNRDYSRMYQNSSWTEWESYAYNEITETGINIPENADLNTYINNGIYQCPLTVTARTISNLPYTGDERIAFKLVVMKIRNDTNLMQWYIPYSSNTSVSHTEVAYRATDDNGVTWYEWSHLARMEDISQIQGGSGYANGTVNGSAISATITGFQLKEGVIVSIKMPSEVQTDATLNINNTGAKSIKYFADRAVSYGHPLFGNRIYTFIYDGTYYRVIALDHTPNTSAQDYVADTSGSIVLDWGVDANRAQIKYNIGSDKLRWNYYKNSTWRGDRTLLDVDNGIETNRTIGSDSNRINSVEDIPVNTAGIVNITATLSPINLAGAYGYICYGKSGAHRVIELTRLNHTNKNTEEKWYQAYNDVTWTGWMPLSRTGTYIGTCSTAADQQIKVATVDDDFCLKKGVRIALKFTNTNTYNATTSDPCKLNVNSTGAKQIFYSTTATPTGTRTSVFGYANHYIYYIYDGTYWVWAGHSADDDSTNFIPNNASSTIAADLVTLSAKNTGIDAQASDNGVTESQYPSLSSINDKNNLIMARLEASVYTNGKIGSYWYVRNYNGSTSQVGQKGMRLLMDKSGNLTYEISTPNKFNAAIGFGYGTCTTAADQQVKAVTLADFVLSVGATINVRFTNTNTYSSSTSAPCQLNVNGTGAKNIWYNNTHSGAGNTGVNTRVYGEANRVFTYMYDGTYWVWVNCGYEADTNNRRSFYGTCSTEAATADKVVTLSSTSGWELVAGTIVGVKFTNSNTAENVTLNVNGSGAKSIVWNTSTYAGKDQNITGKANLTIYYMYNGSAWVFFNTSYNYTVASNNRKAYYGTCSSAADATAKVVTLATTSGWELSAGTVVGVRYTNTNTASSVTLNVNSTGAKSIYYNNAVYTGSSNAVCGVANRTTFYMYDGTYWVFLAQGIANSDTYTSAYCSTAAATAAKVASCTGYALLSKSLLHIIITTSNTAKSALTLNVNGKGAKPIYINGSASSASNYTLPAGSYLIYYNGTNYYFRTDGKITCAGTVTI